MLYCTTILSKKFEERGGSIFLFLIHDFSIIMVTVYLLLYCSKMGVLAVNHYSFCPLKLPTIVQ